MAESKLYKSSLQWPSHAGNQHQWVLTSPLWQRWGFAGPGREVIYRKCHLQILTRVFIMVLIDNNHHFVDRYMMRPSEVDGKPLHGTEHETFAVLSE